MDHILLIDGMNAIWRANVKFAQKPEDKQTPSFVIVYNFFRSLRATIEEFNPIKVFFCLEGNNNFRKGIYPEYKANRIVKTSSVDKPNQTDDFYRQVNIIVDLISKLPITIVNANRFEADDVIATLAEDLKDEEVIAISNDSDLIQLLQKSYKHFRIYDPIKKQYVIAPDWHYLTAKSLFGDKKTDNILGLVSMKVGIKLASNIEKFKTFMESHENRSSYLLNRELIELKLIPNDELQFVEHHINFETIKAQFLYMDFKTMLEPKYWDRFVETFSGLR